MVTIIVASTKFDAEHLIGQFVDESHYDILVDQDADCYTPRNCDAAEILDCDQDCNNCDKGQDERRIAFKFRKNWFTKEEQEQAYEGLRDAATPSNNRGMAAGPRGSYSGSRWYVTDYQQKILDYIEQEPETSFTPFKDILKEIDAKESKEHSSHGAVWLTAQIEEDGFEFDKWVKRILKMTVAERKASAADVVKCYISGTHYANKVNSGIAGWYDRYPRAPFGRATAYTQHHYSKFEKSFPFLQSLNRGFKELMPQRWSNQRKAADTLDQRFLVPDTVFTTITVNKTFRTACHRDAGDFNDGLSNLLVLSNNGKFTGGYLVFPEYRIAVNVRPGDLLLVNNHEVIHGNTPIETYDDGERISLVCYLREGMLELGSKEYEDARFNYVEERKRNKEHPDWRKGWNGISPGMWSHHKWYDYLREVANGEEMIKKYHPEAIATASALDSLWD
jgi:hypothetical protein